MAVNISLKEIDGSRTVTLTRNGDCFTIDTGDHCYVFDSSIALRAFTRVFNVAVILEDATPTREQ